MSIEFIEIMGVHIPMFLGGVFLGALVFIFFLYVIFREKLKTFVIFDLSLILFSTGVLLSRLIAILDNWSLYSSYSWSFLPLKDNGNRVIFERVLPWELLNIFDGNLVLWMLPIGIIFGCFFIYLNSNKKIDIFLFLDNIVLAAIPVQIVLSFTAIFLGLYFGKDSGGIDIYVESIGESRLNTPLVEIGAFALIVLMAMMLYSLKARKGLLTAFYLVGNGIVGLLLFSKASFVQESMLHYSLSALVIALGVLILTIALFAKKAKTSKDNIIVEKKSTITEGNELINQQILTDIESERQTLLGRLRSIFKR